MREEADDGREGGGAVSGEGDAVRGEADAVSGGAEAVTEGAGVVGREAEGPAYPSREARTLARRLSWAGLGLFWIVLLALVLGAGMALVDAILLAVLLAAVPALAIAQVPLVDDLEIERLPAYWSSIATLWVLGGACWLVGARSEGVAALGLVGLPAGPLVLWSVGLAAAGLLIIVLFHGLARATGALDSDLLEQLLPRTPRERRVFALLSVAAGTGEELAYRGYAIPVLAPLLGLTGAAVLSTAVFGVIHAYQGALGIVRTGLMGGVLAWGFLASGSLWPPIIAHTLIDLVAGIALGDKLLVTPER